MEKKVSLCQLKKDSSIKKIIRESKHLIEEKGFYNTSIKELCERSMISKTTFFNYFKNKATIVFLIAEENLDELKEYRDNELSNIKNPLDKIRLLNTRIFEDLNRYNNLSAVLYQLISESNDESRILQRHRNLRKPLVIEAQEKGYIRDDISHTEIDRLIEGCILSIFYDLRPEKRISAFNKSFDTLLTLLCP